MILFLAKLLMSNEMSQVGESVLGKNYSLSVLGDIKPPFLEVKDS